MCSGNDSSRVRTHPDPENQRHTQYPNDTYVVADREQHFVGSGGPISLDEDDFADAVRNAARCMSGSARVIYPPLRSEAVCSPLFIDEVGM